MDYFTKLGVPIWTLILAAILLLLGFHFIGRRFYLTRQAHATPHGTPEASEAKKNNYPVAVKSLLDQQIQEESKFVSCKFLERAAPSSRLEKVATFSSEVELVRKGTLNLEFSKDRMIAYFAGGTVKLWNWGDSKENTIKFGIKFKDVTSLQHDEEIVVLGTAAGTVHLFDAKSYEEKWSIRFEDPVGSVKFFESTLIIFTRGARVIKFWWVLISRSDMKLLNRKLVRAIHTSPVSWLVRWLFPNMADSVSESMGFLVHSLYYYLYQDSLVKIWYGRSGNRFTGARGHVCCLLASDGIGRFSVTDLISTNQFLIARCKDGSIAMWNIYELRSSMLLPLKVFKGHKVAIRSLCALNGHVLSVDQSGKLFMWSGYDLENDDVDRPVPRVLAQNFFNVSCLAGDERWIVSSSSENGIINIWALPDLWLRAG